MMTGVVELVSLGRTFGHRPPVRALVDITLQIHPGEYVAVLGPSGSGKSTLLNILGLLDRPTQGRYLLEGLDTATVPDRELARLRAAKLGFVFQAFHLLENRTIEENVEIAEIYQRGSRRGRYQRAVTALQEVGLGHRLGFTPRTLSGGERQRVAVARALVRKPTVLLCDEPTGNLDSQTSARVLDLIDGVRRPEMCVVVITHNPDVAARATRTLQLLDGRLEP